MITSHFDNISTYNFKKNYIAPVSFGRSKCSRFGKSNITNALQETADCSLNEGKKATKKRKFLKTAATVLAAVLGIFLIHKGINSLKSLDKIDALTGKLENFKSDIKNTKFDTTPANKINYLTNNLLPHNYEEDKSIIQICTSGKDAVYNWKTIDLKNNKIYNCKKETSYGFYPDTDSAGDYLIATLNNGKKYVRLIVPTGQKDCNNNNIKTVIEILSDKNNFSEIQKDLLSYISCLKNVSQKENLIDKNYADLLSLPTSQPNSPLDKDILLSCIYSAKNAIKNDIDKNFISKALTLNDGEQMMRCYNS